MEQTAITDDEQKFEAIFRNNPVCTSLTRYSDGKFLDANDAFLRLTGYSKDELVGKTALEINLWVDPSARAKIIEGLTQNGRSTKIETMWRQKSGNIIDIRVEALITIINGEKYMLGFVEDVTAEKLNVAKLAESEEKFKNAFSNSMLGMAIVSPQGKWLQANKSVCDMLGYSSEELMNMDFATITHPEETSRDLAAVKKIAAGEIENYQVEKRYITKSGQTIWVSIHVAPVRDQNKKLLYFITQIENIDQRKRNETELKEKNAEMVKMNQMMVGRELKMVELKKEIEELKEKK